MAAPAKSVTKRISQQPTIKSMTAPMALSPKGTRMGYAWSNQVESFAESMRLLHNIQDA